MQGRGCQDRGAAVCGQARVRDQEVSGLPLAGTALRSGPAGDGRGGGMTGGDTNGLRLREWLWEGRRIDAGVKSQIDHKEHREHKKE